MKDGWIVIRPDAVFASSDGRAGPPALSAARRDHRVADGNVVGKVDIKIERQRRHNIRADYTKMMYSRKHSVAYDPRHALG